MDLPIAPPSSIQTLRTTVPDMENAKIAIDSAFNIIPGVMASVDRKFLEKDPTIVVAKVDFSLLNSLGCQMTNDLNMTLLPRRQQLFTNLNNFTVAAQKIVSKFDSGKHPVGKLEVEAYNLYMSGMSVWNEFQEWLNMFNLLVIASANNILSHLSTCRAEGQAPFTLHTPFEV